jgi:hypothetical protein
MPDYLKVVDHPELVRDPESNAILNTDLKALHKYREERDRLLKSKMEHEQLKIDVANTKKDISEIKELLIKVLEKK